MEKEKKNEIFDKLKVLSQEISKRSKELNSELSQVDKEISDISHYIEFYPLSASEGYMMAKMLKDCFARRREIKNEVEVLKQISSMTVGYIKSNNAQNSINKVFDKHYTPRVLKDLFTKKSSEY